MVNPNSVLARITQDTTQFEDLTIYLLIFTEEYMYINKNLLTYRRANQNSQKQCPMFVYHRDEYKHMRISCHKSIVKPNPIPRRALLTTKFTVYNVYTKTKLSKYSLSGNCIVQIIEPCVN